MFTSLDLDEKLFMQAWSLSGKKTKRAFVEDALRLYVRLHEQAGVRALRGRLVWEGEIDDIRRDRDADPR